MAKIVVMSASPRKGGTSDLLCDEFLRGAAEAGHQAEKILLRDKSIGYCTACGICQGNDGICVLNHDMAGCAVLGNIAFMGAQRADRV